MSKPPKLEIMAAQIYEAKISEEEVLFNTFFKTKVSTSFYKSKKPCFISKKLSLDLSFMRQIISKPSQYACENPILHLILLSHGHQPYGNTCVYTAG